VTRLVEFLFIVAVPVAVVAGTLITLFAVGALFDTLDHPEQLKGRIEGAFRRPGAPPRATGRGHYYKPFWASR
jgi:hypothetical protein